jgi:hypothetical protein
MGGAEPVTRRVDVRTHTAGQASTRRWSCSASESASLVVIGIVERQHQRQRTAHE